MFIEQSPPMSRADWTSVSREYLALALGFALLAIPTLISLARQSWTTELGAHGPIVLATGVWLLSQSLPREGWRASPRGWRGFALLVLALPVYVFGRAYDFISLEVGALYLVMLAVAWRLLKWEQFRKIGFPLLYLGFLVPPPGWLIDQLTAPLQLLASSSVTRALSALGYPIVNSGVTLFIAQYQLLVEQACSGMNSLVGLTAIMLFYIYLVHRSSWRHALALGLCIVPIALFVNILRVAALVLITYYMGDAAAQGFLHMTTGIVLFAMALAIAFALDWGVRRISGAGAR